MTRLILSSAAFLASLGFLWVGVYALASLPHLGGSDALAWADSAVRLAVWLIVGFGALALCWCSAITCVVALGGEE
jgi:hypothetical protein